MLKLGAITYLIQVGSLYNWAIFFSVSNSHDRTDVFPSKCQRQDLYDIVRI